MNAAEILAALNTVERDHEMVLKKVQALKDVVSYLLDPDHADVPDVVAKLWELDEYFAKAFPAHTVEEETTLFPLLERHAPGGPELVARLQREHQEIHLKREEFSNFVEMAIGVQDVLPRMVLRDLLADAWALWELLDQHAHKETQAVYQCLTQAWR
jgi:iron-sulfur cluster repair protein YtfE (RIC family)